MGIPGHADFAGEATPNFSTLPGNIPHIDCDGNPTAPPGQQASTSPTGPPAPAPFAPFQPAVPPARPAPLPSPVAGPSPAPVPGPDPISAPTDAPDVIETAEPSVVAASVESADSSESQVVEQPLALAEQVDFELTELVTPLPTEVTDPALDRARSEEVVRDPQQSRVIWDEPEGQLASVLNDWGLLRRKR